MLDLLFNRLTEEKKIAFILKAIDKLKLDNALAEALLTKVVKSSGNKVVSFIVKD